MANIGLKRQKLRAPSTTRGVERISTLSGFVDAFVAIFNRLNYMKLNINKDFDHLSSDARLFFYAIQKFEFIATLLITANLLDHIWLCPLNCSVGRLMSRSLSSKSICWKFS